VGVRQEQDLLAETDSVADADLSMNVEAAAHVEPAVCANVQEPAYAITALKVGHAAEHGAPADVQAGEP
jgi:hypothetical protein